MSGQLSSLFVAVGCANLIMPKDARDWASDVCREYMHSRMIEMFRG